MIDRYKSDMQDHLVLDSALFSSKLEVMSVVSSINLIDTTLPAVV